METLVEKYHAVFSDELECVKGFEARLQLKEGATPKCLMARQVPHALKPRVEAELQSLVKMGILTPIETSEYTTPVVPVIKKDGGISRKPHHCHSSTPCYATPLGISQQEARIFSQTWPAGKCFRN